MFEANADVRNYLHHDKIRDAENPEQKILVPGCFLSGASTA
jgi:hypothetical protein